MGMSMQSRRIAGTAAKAVVAYAASALLLFPVYWMVITSVKSTPEIFSATPTFFPHTFTLEPYIKQIVDRNVTMVPLYVNFRNSFLIAGTTMLLSTTLSSLSAYGLARYNNRVTRGSMFAILVTQMMPATLFLAPLFIIFNRMYMLDTFFAPVIYVCLHSIPFCVLTLRPYFLSIPRELEDSAIIDGCNKLSAFVRIMVPISYPGIIVAATFTFLWGWGDLMAALTFIRSETKYPMTMNMYKAITDFGVEWNNLMAFAVIITVPVLLILVFLQRYLVDGLTSGAVKG